MNNQKLPRRLPAEWENEGAIMLSWPHKDSDWAYMLDEVTRCYVALSKAILETRQRLYIVAPDVSVPRSLLGALPQERIIYVETPTNDTWVRDFGPITVELSDDNTPVAVDFQFNGWGLKFASDKDNLVTSSLSNRHALTGAYENALSFVLEGGSIESDGQGTILTTTRCLMSANRNGGMTREQIAEELCVRLGASHILWLDHGALAGDDTDSHIDTLVRMAPNDTLIYTGCNNPEDEHFEELKRMEDQLRTFTTREGAPYNLVWLPLPDPIYDEDGLRMPATYANYLVTPDAVLMPSYGQPQNDQLAAMILHSVFEREVIAVDCRALVMQHGSLHCATMQIPEAILPV